QGREMLRRSEVFLERIRDMLLFAYLAERSARQRLERVEFFLRQLFLQKLETLHRKYIVAVYRARTPVLLVVMRRRMEDTLFAQYCDAIAPYVQTAEEFRRALLCDAEHNEAVQLMVVQREADARALMERWEDAQRSNIIHWVIADVRRGVIVAEFAEWLFLRDAAMLQMLEMAGRGLILRDEAAAIEKVEHDRFVAASLTQHLREQRRVMKQRKTTQELLAAHQARRDQERQRAEAAAREKKLRALERNRGLSSTERDSLSRAAAGAASLEAVEATESELRTGSVRDERSRRRDIMQMEVAFRSALCLKLGIPLSKSVRPRRGKLHNGSFTAEN
ncbi:MAG: hypothetical protein Q8J97_01420, partial [Flavobacteriaceae bacterium]|nr:hypothetical protein [Flavobacteriaceae bacterium]